MTCLCFGQCELYEELIRVGANLEPKDFAVGFRVEHPQTVVNAAQYGEHSEQCLKNGKGALPPASYRLATTVNDAEEEGAAGGAEPSGAEGGAKGGGAEGGGAKGGEPGGGHVRSHAKTASGRGVYSFCMCPGGQIVPTATREDQVSGAA